MGAANILAFANGGVVVTESVADSNSALPSEASVQKEIPRAAFAGSLLPVTKPIVVKENRYKEEEKAPAMGEIEEIIKANELLKKTEEVKKDLEEVVVKPVSPKKVVDDDYDEDFE